MAAQWTWQDDDGKFVPLDAPTTAAIEAAFQAGKKSVTTKAGLWKYRVDFEAMTQTNQSSNKVRALRRTVPDDVPQDAPSEGARGWQWKDDDGQWYDYSQEDADALEAKFLEGAPTADLPMRGWTYSFDFAKMAQTNTETGTVRSVQRRAAKLVKRPAESADTEATPTKRPKLAAAGAEEDSRCEAAPAAPAVSTPAPAFKWQLHDGSLLWRCCGPVPPATVVYGFDMDSTLIETKSGKTFATDRRDWKWLLPEVPATLKRLHAEGKRVVIFSNQGGIGGKGWNESLATAVRGKIDDLAEALGFPLFAFVAAKDDKFRKPATTMWDFMIGRLNGGAPCDLDKCVYVGDAAGRPAGWMPGRKKDFSCSDRKFAFNVGVDFKTPEEFFLGAKPATFKWDGVDPRSFTFASKITDSDDTVFHKPGQEVVVFCGMPASGKTTFANRHFLPHGYVHINRDTLKTPKKCFDAAKAALAAGKSCVIDNTMPKSKSDDKDKCNGREAYIKLAKTHGVPCRVFVFKVPEDLAKHLNYFRERLSNGKEAHVPGIGYNVFKKSYEEPTAAEGWAEIKPIYFVPKFENDKAKKLFMQMA